MILDRISSPSDLSTLTPTECEQLAAEIRQVIVETVSKNAGHLGSNLGAVELTIALHRVFESPQDVLLFDTGHQAYAHKLLTGRYPQFSTLRRAGGLSGYPNRSESEHDVIENSHASTALSWSHGIAAGFRAAAAAAAAAAPAAAPSSGAAPPRQRHVVAVVGDGALTGGMAYEALNNLGHSAAPVMIVLNDNGRSYAPTVSALSASLTGRRTDPIARRLGIPTSEVVFFEALGLRYLGPIDGHDEQAVEQALREAAASTGSGTGSGPIVVHLLTSKGKGYEPAEQDPVSCLHDLKIAGRGESYGAAFTAAILAAAERDERLVAITAAMPGPTGLLEFQKRFPDRYFDVGIAEQHAMTAAAGMAHEGARPVVCIYSTFLQRCVDQWNLDVGMHAEPVVVVADRAGITGDDGPSHHGIYDLHTALAIPDVAIYVPSEPAEVGPALDAALAGGTSALVRYPKTLSPGPLAPAGRSPAAGHHRVLVDGDDDVVIVGIGKLARAAVEAARLVGDAAGLVPTVLDPRRIRPADPELIERCANARLVVTAEDGIALGGAGSYLASLVADRARATLRPQPEVITLGVPTAYLPHGKPDDILAALGLDGTGLAGRVLEALPAQASAPPAEWLAAVGARGRAR